MQFLTEPGELSPLYQAIVSDPEPLKLYPVVGGQVTAYDCVSRAVNGFRYSWVREGGVCLDTPVEGHRLPVFSESENDLRGKGLITADTPAC